MSMRMVLLVALFAAGPVHASGWYLQKQYATPMRYVLLTNERHTFEVEGLSCWVSEPTYRRQADAMKKGSSYVVESREIGCALPSGHEVFDFVSVPKDPGPVSLVIETLKMRTSGKLIAPTLAWSNIPLALEGE